MGSYAEGKILPRQFPPSAWDHFGGRAERGSCPFMTAIIAILMFGMNLWSFVKTTTTRVLPRVWTFANYFKREPCWRVSCWGGEGWAGKSFNRGVGSHSIIVVLTRSMGCWVGTFCRRLNVVLLNLVYPILTAFVDGFCCVMKMTGIHTHPKRSMRWKVVQMVGEASSRLVRMAVEISFCHQIK